MPGGPLGAPRALAALVAHAVGPPPADVDVPALPGVDPPGLREVERAACLLPRRWALVVRLGPDVGVAARGDLPQGGAAEPHLALPVGRIVAAGDVLVRAPGGGGHGLVLWGAAASAGCPGRCPAAHYGQGSAPARLPGSPPVLLLLPAGGEKLLLARRGHRIGRPACSRSSFNCFLVASRALSRR